MIFQVLIVDDEPHVVESISTLMESIPGFEMELHGAYRAQQAIEVMQQTRIDLLLTDIQMPGMNGLGLIREAKKLWPDCVLAVLSAYSDFQYAYDAIGQGVAAYILKAEEEDEIQARLKALLQQAADALNHREWSADPVLPPYTLGALQQTVYMRLIYDAQISEEATREALNQIGFHSFENGLVPLMVICRPEECINEPLLRSALWRYLGQRVPFAAFGALSASRYFLLLETTTPPELLVSMLESVQTAIQSTGGQELSFLLGQTWYTDRSLNQARHTLKRLAMKQEERFEMCIVEMGKFSAAGRVTVDFIKTYIQEHISEELTLGRLAQVTGYNASYLSRVFSTEMHEPLVRYVARRKLEAIRRLMLDPALSLDQIMEMANFNSRSYFNSFIKKETGLSPRRWRAEITQKNED